MQRALSPRRRGKVVVGHALKNCYQTIAQLLTGNMSATMKTLNFCFKAILIPLTTAIGETLAFFARTVVIPQLTATATGTCANCALQFDKSTQVNACTRHRRLSAQAYSVLRRCDGHTTNVVVDVATNCARCTVLVLWNDFLYRIFLSPLLSNAP